MSSSRSQEVFLKKQITFRNFLVFNYFDQQTRIHPLLPYGIMGIGAFVAAMLCLTLPETKDQPTAELVRNDVNDVTVKELKDDLDREDEKMEFTSRL